MTTFKKPILAFLENFKADLKQDQKNKNLYASGRSARSLTPDSSDLKGSLKGSHYFFFQKFGRRPGGFPPIDSILQWMKAKGVQPDGDISERSLAFLIARKIARQGTDIFQRKRDGLSTPPPNYQKNKTELRTSIIELIRQEYSAALKTKKETVA